MRQSPVTKIWLAGYPRPGKPDLPTGDCKLHNLGCRYLKPTPHRPYTRPVKASPAEQVSQPKCLVC